MSRRYAVMLAILVAAWLYAPRAAAIPVFARKYGVRCTMCHSNFPRLNDFGYRFRLNGYRLPGKERLETTVLQPPAPIALRTSVGFTHDKFTDTPEAEDVSQFQVNGLDILSGGLLAPRLGYILVYPPKLEPSRGVEGQPGTVEMASVVFAPLDPAALHVRVGRMEPAYVAFSDKRRLTVSPYEIYDLAFPGGPALSDTQNGIELSSFPGWGRWQLAAGWLNGSETNLSDDSPSDVYVRAATVIGRGLGETAGQRIGVVGYWGRARPEVGVVTSRESFHRYGVDASLNWRQWNLGLQLLHGKDSGALWDQPDDVGFTGGFAQALYMPATNFVGIARWGWANLPNGLHSDISRVTLGGRYYFDDNVALAVEYSHRTQGGGEPGLPDQKENLATARVDFAF